MPRFLAIGENIQTGTGYFNNTKTVNITFDKPFKKKPRITITMGDEGSKPIYRIDVSLTGFSVRAKTNWTGEFDWMAVERK